MQLGLSVFSLSTRSHKVEWSPMFLRLDEVYPKANTVFLLRKSTFHKKKILHEYHSPPVYNNHDDEG